MFGGYMHHHHFNMLHCISYTHQIIFMGNISMWGCLIKNLGENETAQDDMKTLPKVSLKNMQSILVPIPFKH